MIDFNLIIEIHIRYYIDIKELSTQRDHRNEFFFHINNIY
jgi:hypothetical protein